METGSRELREGTVVGEWRVQKPLGSGGQGTVYSVRARTEKHAPPRALKACFAIDDKPRERFRREIALLQSCRSPNVLSIVEAHPTWEERVQGVVPFAYYVAERCDGAINDSKVDLGDFRRRLAWFREACDAIHYLHSLSDPVIHRDIKPSNFLLAQEPRRIVVADFGIAKNEIAPSDLTATREVVGTQHYRAPEVLNGAPGNAQSDVYSLGRLLEWLMTGDISTDLGARAVPRGGDLEDGACDAIDRVITKATQAVAAHRYTSARELIDQLPDLWISVRPRLKPATPASSHEPSLVWANALALARSNDRVGWWQLEQELRRAYPAQIKAWRAESDGVTVKTRQEHPALVDRLLTAVGGRLMFALAGVVSQQTGFVDQTRMIGDLLTVPEWPGGREHVFQAREGLLFVFQYLHGALSCERGRFDVALHFASSAVPHANRDQPMPLWRRHDLTGWPKLLGGACTDAWHYVANLRARFLPLAEAFVLPSDFDVGLASYSMLLCLLEFAHDSKKFGMKSEKEWRELRLRLDVPPMFAATGHDVMRTAASKVFGNAEVVATVVDRAGADHALMQAQWPYWLTIMLRYYGEINRSFFPEDGWPLGPLA